MLANQIQQQIKRIRNHNQVEVISGMQIGLTLKNQPATLTE